MLFRETVAVCCENQTQHTDTLCLQNVKFLTSMLKQVTSRQGNNEEQAHTRNKGTNEHDWKETAIFLETSINT
jgi:hypothetical protein